MPNIPNFKLQIIERFLDEADAKAVYDQVREMYDYYLHKMVEENWTDQQVKDYCTPILKLTWALIRLSSYQKTEAKNPPAILPVTPVKPPRPFSRGIKKQANIISMDIVPPGMAG